MEGAHLGLFMLSACAFTTLLYHPGSPLGQLVIAPTMRLILMGLAMALTAVAIVYSPWGRRSGADLILGFGAGFPTATRSASSGRRAPGESNERIASSPGKDFGRHDLQGRHRHPR